VTATDQYASVRYLVDDVQAAIDFYTTTSASASTPAPRPAGPCGHQAPI
jgi:hypothetical protein